MGELSVCSLRDTGSMKIDYVAHIFVLGLSGLVKTSVSSASNDVIRPHMAV